MRRSRQCLRTLVICVAAAVVSHDRGVADEPVDPAVSELLAAHNFIRKRNKLEPLTLSPELCRSAELHARDMANHEKMTHTGSDGSNPIQRARRAGYGSSFVGENVAVSQWTVEQVMSDWMDSRGHRGNILGKYTEMGAARVQDELGNYFWCVNFGAPRAAMRTAGFPRRGGPRSDRPKAALKPEERAMAVVKQMNRDREVGRMVVLHPDPRLARAAMTLSEAMAARDSLEVDDDPLKWVDRSAVEGRDLRVQRIARVTTVEQAARELQPDDVELSHSFREVGVGYAVARSGKPYWCVIFARPAEIEPPAGRD